MPNATRKKHGHRYTPFFCEENIWWLAHDLSQRGVALSDMQVLFFSNPLQYLLMFNQLTAPAGQVQAWDYHVVLLLENADVSQIFDFDTRLPFGCDTGTYLASSFPQPKDLPGELQARVRSIPAEAFLRHFASDRSHMIGVIPQTAFPDYPPIHPEPGITPIQLADYWNMQRELPDGSKAQALNERFSAFRPSDAVAQPGLD